jgi:hypothetical protein
MTEGRLCQTTDYFLTGKDPDRHAVKSLSSPAITRRTKVANVCTHYCFPPHLSTNRYRFGLHNAAWLIDGALIERWSLILTNAFT